MNEFVAPIQVLITGTNGLLGYHARAALLAENCAADFQKTPRRYKLIDSPRLTNETLAEWSELLVDADLVLHFAGINRAEAHEVEFGNIDIAKLLVEGLSAANSSAHVVYANSTHAGKDSPYGRGKQAAHELLVDWSDRNSGRYTNVVLPHIFGENARPNYNNVTATLCHQVVDGKEPTIHSGAAVELLHAGKAVDAMLLAFEDHQTGSIRLEGRHISVKELYRLLLEFKKANELNTYPLLNDPFMTFLFNTFRTVGYPDSFPVELKLHTDDRGTLFEAVKGGGGGQTFLSWTKPGVERGNHFHRSKVERFLVVSGTAEIKIRPLFSDQIDTFAVSGDKPAYVDMPTLHTHSIVNTGSEPLLTLFWTHEIFDPNNPDTFAHLVDITKRDN